MTSTYTQQRRTHLETLAAQLPEYGLVGRLLGGEDPMLWVWHPTTGKQTIIFATPTKDGWLFLWSPNGQAKADATTTTVELLRKALADPPT
ncbi:hypothetical protein SAMN05421505_102114 [Sinosporangium album]|uniref:Uncharacterized protein n=1 Tax=Sinosporangium album TaxID=504805 RepID=A0A1G7RZV2_9ACTN|nr:hypothetical protein [Sinosporangium album]SDG16315.1 hypothetical protein SAMN05421505_102114 [Sinosporangium album]